MPRIIRFLLAVMALWLVACELHGLGVHGMPTGSEKWLHLVMMGLGAGLCLLRAALRREERVAWTLIGGGVLAWTLGELYFTTMLWNDAAPPVPSPADVGYLLLPPLVFAGILLLAQSQVRGLPKTLWVDGLTAGLSVGAVCAALVLRVVLPSVGGSTASIITNLTYPVLDLILLGLIFGLLAMQGRRSTLRFCVIAFGVLCFWGADSIYLVKSADGTWVSGGPFDPGWWTIALCAASAAWMPPPSQRRNLTIKLTIRVPVIFALMALAVLVAGYFAPVSVPAVVLASGALVSIIVRLILTFRAHAETLEGSRHEAVTDPLTGLGNRRALAAALEARIDGHGAEPAILALFDLNGFKNYNDTFGHSAGDALLIRLADQLRQTLGSSAAFRMGGDEFCVLLPGGAAGEALLAAASSVLRERGDGFAITASLGSVRLPLETSDIGEALRLADQRMYAQKHSTHSVGTAQEIKRTLLFAVAQRDPELTHHLDEVGSLATAIAHRLGCGPDECERIGIAAELHDIGKVAIPEGILNKAGALDETEWQLMRQHTVIGERIIDSSTALTGIGPLVRSSHERFDGRGYPDGLSGSEIPLGARIIAVCDSFNAMTSDRVYRRAMSTEVALEELGVCAGSQFDPKVVAAFLTLPQYVGRAGASRAHPLDGSPLGV